MSVDSVESRCRDSEIDFLVAQNPQLKRARIVALYAKLLGGPAEQSGAAHTDKRWKGAQYGLFADMFFAQLSNRSFARCVGDCKRRKRAKRNTANIQCTSAQSNNTIQY